MKNKSKCIFCMLVTLFTFLVWLTICISSVAIARSTITFAKDACGNPLYLGPYESIALSKMYLPLGVTWEGGGVISVTGLGGVAVTAKPYIYYGNSGTYETSDTMYFTSSQSAVSFQTNGQGYSGGSITLTITAFNSNNAIVDEIILNMEGSRHGDSTVHTVELSGGIKSIQYSMSTLDECPDGEAPPCGSFFIDNLTFEFEPKPTVNLQGDNIQYVCDVNSIHKDLNIDVVYSGTPMSYYIMISNEDNSGEYFSASTYLGPGIYPLMYVLPVMLYDNLSIPGNYRIDIYNCFAQTYMRVKTIKDCEDLSIFSVGPTYPNSKSRAHIHFSPEAENIINIWKCYAQANNLKFSSKLFNGPPSCNNILKEIKQQADSLTRNDVFVFSFSGHGSTDHILLDYDGSYQCAITAQQLYDALKPLADIGVRLYVLLDSCKSGSFDDELRRLASKTKVTAYFASYADTKTWRICTPDNNWISNFNFLFFDSFIKEHDLQSCAPSLVYSQDHICPVSGEGIETKDSILIYTRESEEDNTWEEELALHLANLNNWPELIGNYISNQYGEEGVMSEEVWNPQYRHGTLPTLNTTVVTDFLFKSAVSGGNITCDGGFPVTSRGVCWSKTRNPTIDDNKTTDGTGTGSFTSSITNLVPGIPYHVRAYATNSEGTAYGNNVNFITNPPSTPILGQQAINLLLLLNP